MNRFLICYKKVKMFRNYFLFVFIFDCRDEFVFLCLTI